MSLTKKEAIDRHKQRLARLTNREVANLMQHADNKTPLIPVGEMDTCFVDFEGKA